MTRNLMDRIEKIRRYAEDLKDTIPAYYLQLMTLADDLEKELKAGGCA